MAQVSSSSSVTLVEFKRVRSLIPETWEDQVRTIDIAEHKEAAVSLAQAFATDDLAKYLMGAKDMVGLTDEQKWRLHVNMYKYIVASHCYDGTVTTIGPEYDAVALWMPPGSTEDWFSWLRSGLWRLYYQLPTGGKNRYYKELIPLLHDTKHEVMGDRDNDCYYLVYIGTKPSGRGKGYARKLIEHMAARADAEGRAMYLESTSASNNAYYGRFGFKHVKDIYLGTPPPPQTTAAGGAAATNKEETYVSMAIMVREPQTPKKTVIGNVGTPTSAATVTTNTSGNTAATAGTGSNASPSMSNTSIAAIGTSSLAGGNLKCGAGGSAVTHHHPHEAKASVGAVKLQISAPTGGVKLSTAGFGKVM